MADSVPFSFPLIFHKTFESHWKYKVFKYKTVFSIIIETHWKYGAHSLSYLPFTVIFPSKTSKFFFKELIFPKEPTLLKLSMTSLRNKYGKSYPGMSWYWSSFQIEREWESEREQDITNTNMFVNLFVCLKDKIAQW